MTPVFQTSLLRRHLETMKILRFFRYLSSPIPHAPQISYMYLCFTPKHFDLFSVYTISPEPPKGRDHADHSLVAGI